MKKFICLFLVLAMLFSLSACRFSKDERKMLREAMQTDMCTIYSAYRENTMDATNTYDDKIIKFSGVVSSIQEKHITMDFTTEQDLQSFFVVVFLDEEDIANLKEAQMVTIVGKLDLSDIPYVNNAFVAGN